MLDFVIAADEDTLVIIVFQGLLDSVSRNYGLWCPNLIK